MTPSSRPPTGARSSPHVARDPLGLVRRYRRLSDGQEAPRLRDLLPPRPARALDAHGVAIAWGEAPEGPNTCFVGLETLPRGSVTATGNAGEGEGKERGRGAGSLAGARPGAEAALWRDRLVEAARRLKAPRGPTAVALSGGLDSALVLALLLTAGVDDLKLYAVSSGFAGYDELPAARATAWHFGYPLEVITVGEAEFLEALPTCIVAAETALYNLHPLERWLLAKAVAARGHTSLVTGDGADQVFAGAPPAIFLPILSALFEAARVDLQSPFFEPAIVNPGLGRPPDPEKALLREIGRSVGVPAAVLARKKLVRLAPAMDLGRYLDKPRLEALARSLNRPLTLATDRERVQWATLGVLWERI